MPDRRATLARRLGAVLGLGVVIWIAAGAVGFPRVFQWYFVGYVLVAAAFFALLDAPPGRLPKRPALAILAFFLVLSALLTAVAALLPQYDPRVEIEKVKRLQQVALEREQARQLENLKRLAEKQGLTLVKAGAAGAVVAAAPAALGTATAVTAAPRGPDPKLVDRGRQVYDDYECYNCHKLGGKGGVKRRGPELDNTGNVLSPEMARAKLLDPHVFMTEGYDEEYRKTIMPDDFKERMGDKEIEALVAYMMSLRNDKASPPTPKPLFKAPSGWVFVPRDGQRVMPTGWWTDAKIIARGKQVYEGAVKSDVTCAACHGRDGQPVLTGARDFRDPQHAGKMSETYWFWRLSDGVPQTPMTPMKDKLTEEERWQAIAYQHTFSHGGKAEDHAH